MSIGRTPKQPLYVLPHGIKVIGEYAPTVKNPYWRVRIRPHPFFPDVLVVSNGCDIRKSRVMLASKLGRAIAPNEIAHHVNEDKTDDRPENIKLETATSHNRHHKTGFSHTTGSKGKISEGLLASYATGKHRRTAITERDKEGKILCSR